MKEGRNGLSKGMIQQTLNNYDIILEETSSIFNRLKDAEKLPDDVCFAGYVYIDSSGDNVDAFYGEVGGDSGYFQIPIKSYLLDYELEKFIQNFKFEDDIAYLCLH